MKKKSGMQDDYDTFIEDGIQDAQAPQHVPLGAGHSGAIVNYYQWCVDYSALGLDVAVWCTENDLTPAQLDEILGYENVVRNLVSKRRTYGQRSDMLMNNFLYICTALDLNPQNYFDLVRTTSENKLAPTGRGIKK